MPIYQYQCTSCGHDYEVRQGFTARAQGVCPACGGTSHRRFQSVAVIYKGSGFYTTDYKRTNLSEPGKSNGTDGGTSRQEKPKEESAAKAPATTEA
ncbi:MAG: hypothetical protein HY535_01795 [Chloroflexi bacterium]|nr:hypothetical protein [Chloroflexota bacterium]